MVPIFPKKEGEQEEVKMLINPQRNAGVEPYYHRNCFCTPYMMTKDDKKS